MTKRIYTLDDGTTGTADEIAALAPHLHPKTVSSRLQRSSSAEFVFASPAENRRKTGWHTHALLRLRGSRPQEGRG